MKKEERNENSKKIAKKETSNETITPVSNIDYVSVGEEKNKKTYAKCKKIFMPDKKMITGFILVIMGVLVISAFNFPFASFLSANLNAKVNLGFPLVFASFELSEENSSFYIMKLIGDLIIYLAFAYLFNILMNILMNSKFKEKSVAEEKPTVFKDQTITITEKAIEKVAR